MDYTVHGILQARILEWVAVPFSKGIQGILYYLSHQGNLRILEWVAHPFPVALPRPGIKSGFPALQVDSLPAELSGKPNLLQWRQEYTMEKRQFPE